ncbi:MAG: GDP-mannose 4,6-dehydratase [Deltaproteobacteria bacterium]|nr:GDP-mannose 4,6-dehydratase [Deltaproteobacteria bacterium]MBT8356201.1 GDP-mannose 4,6-dehydratase [Deltaproteobacteria bacterium]
MDYKNIYKGKNVIITGGLGFIGSNLARTLVDLDANVMLIDSLSPEYGGNLYNINGIEDRIKVNISDVRDPHSIKYLIKGQDYLFNLAGQTSHLDSMKDPFADLDINARSQLSILESCRYNNPNIKIIFASTRQIYGKPDYLPVDETHPLRPVDVNGINKMAGEWYHILYNNVYNICACSLRLTNTIGPRMRIKDARQTFLGIWIKLLLEEKPIEVWGGEQLRDFTYVDDCIQAMLMAGVSERVNGQIFNLGGTRVISLEELAKMVIEIHGSGEYIVRQFPDERSKIDIGDYYSDCSLINATLGWKPKTSLEDALVKTIDFYKTTYKHYV